MFNFKTDVREGQFTRILNALEEELEPNQRLEDKFEEVVIARINDSLTKKAPLDMTVFGPYFGLGFKSMSAVQAFLKQHHIISQIGIVQGAAVSATTLPVMLPKSLADKVQTAYQKAAAIEIQIGMQGESVLSTLVPLFDMIKSLSVEEVKLLDEHYPRITSSYLNGNTFVTFHHDLHTMELSDFEAKYEGCWNGFLQNVIQPINDNEIVLSTMATAKSKVAFLSSKEGIHKVRAIEEIRRVAEGLSDDSLNADLQRIMDSLQGAGPPSDHSWEAIRSLLYKTEERMYRENAQTSDAEQILSNTRSVLKTQGKLSQTWSSKEMQLYAAKGTRPTGLAQRQKDSGALPERPPHQNKGDCSMM